VTLRAGSTIGPYQVDAPLGAGGMGAVFRARDTRLGRDVAVKALADSIGAEPDRLARLRREAQTLAALNHPNIATIYGLEETGQGPCLVLELIDGESLAERLARGPLPVRDALEIGVQVAAAVEAAHERGIIHRDLKPANIMITRTGLAKVLDFGLARNEAGPVPASMDPSSSQALTADANATGAGVIVGTVAYMSPEQARGKPLDRRSDVWSFACVVYECLAGRRAFGGETASDLIARVLEREPDWSLLPAGTPPRVRDVLKRCLRKDVEARPRDIRDVRLELADAAAGPMRDADSGEKSIAVLPFENLSGPDDEYFADGITDEILNALSHLEGMRVAARTSCFAFKGRREDLRAIGEKLDVATVLEGSVRRSGPKLRITVQLVNAADGYQLWSERYDRELVDVFELQDEIAGAIAGKLRGALHDEADRRKAGHGTRNLEAFELLLKGRALQTKRGRFLPEAVTCFEKAIALDPNYAEAMAWLSDSYRLMGTFGGSPAGDVMPRALALAEKALAIDSGQAEAWASMATVEEHWTWNFPRAAELWERAITLDPRHGRARTQRALWACIRGDMDDETAVAESTRAIEDDPLNAWVVAMHSHILGVTGRHEESIREAERGVTLDPDSFFAQWNCVRAYAWAGQPDAALALAPSVLRESGRNQWALGTLAWVYGALGRRAEARAVHDELEGRSRHEFVAATWLAVAAGAAGDGERAIGYAERAVAERDPLIVWSRRVPFWDAVRRHPRYEDVTAVVWARTRRGLGLTA
jgi:serine/threonine protein kinase/tetratricopeptide (TPR) repeat protein